MDWNGVAVWTVIAALIAGVAGIVGALIRDAITISGKIGKLDNTTLSSQHKEIQESVDRSASDIQKSVDKSNDTLGQIQSHLMQEKTAQDWRDKNMDARQQEIKSSFDKIQGLVKDWQDVNVENGELAAHNQRLTEQNAALTLKNNELTSTVRNLSEQIGSLKAEKCPADCRQRRRGQRPRRGRFYPLPQHHEEHTLFGNVVLKNSQNP